MRGCLADGGYPGAAEGSARYRRPGCHRRGAGSRVFREALRVRGYVEGENIRLEVRSAECDPQRINKFAEELVSPRVDVIVARSNLATTAAKAATSTIPIVMAPGGAPIEIGLISSLARPGESATGASISSPELGGKPLQLMREVLPTLNRAAVLGNASDVFTKPLAGRASWRSPGS